MLWAKEPEEIPFINIWIYTCICIWAGLECAFGNRAKGNAAFSLVNAPRRAISLTKCSSSCNTMHGWPFNLELLGL